MDVYLWEKMHGNIDMKIICLYFKVDEFLFMGEYAWQYRYEDY